MVPRILVVASTFIAAFAVLLSCHRVLGWTLRLPFLDSALPLLTQSPSSGHYGPFSSGSGKTPAATRGWNILEHQGGNSPWFRKETGVVSKAVDPPEGCRVEQVHMISRHAERYPTQEAGTRMIRLHERLIESNVTFNGDLAFLKDWKFFTDRPADAFEDLVSTGPFAGTLEAFSTGVKLRSRYFHLLEDAIARKATTFWASDSRRVIDTARYFGAGFFGIDWERIAQLVVISEGPENGADTLTPGRTCLDYRYNDAEHGRDNGYTKLNEFIKSYEPEIIARLKQENPEVSLNAGDVFMMQMMCGFEIIARGSSPWCDVFTKHESESFEYSRDLLHYYRAGPGNRYSAAMGWLWLNATANLLHTGPSAGPIFASFVHDGDIVPVLHALDLVPQNDHLPASHVLRTRNWKTSDIVPMGGRILFERLACHVPEKCWSNAPLYPNHVYCEPEHDDLFVRVNVNDGIVAIPGCDQGPGYSCPLAKFMERVRKRGEYAGVFAQVCGLSDDASERITFLHQ